MGELVEIGEFRRQKEARLGAQLSGVPEIQAVSNGVFVSSTVPSYAVLSSGDYLSAPQFAIAGNKLRKGSQHGYTVMTSIALKMVQLDAKASYSTDGSEALSVNSPHDDLYARLEAFMMDPAFTQGGSRSRVLLDRHLVHSALLESEGIDLIKPVAVPSLDEDERQVVRQVFSR
jgi:hypothetical protein